MSLGRSWSGFSTKERFRPGWSDSHRRVKAADLVAYQQRDEAERKKVLDELTAEAEKHGLGY